MRRFEKSDWPDSLNRFVGQVLFHKENAPQQETPANFVQVIDSDIGRSVDFNRIAIHHIVLPPGCRTSSPHAESHEEEFFLVLKGKPHLWLSGWIHDLGENWAVGFPAGTGLAHTVINNTDSDIHLLVAGERTKNENLCSFPLNPELKKDCTFWWDNPPTHSLGPHNGLPGPVRESDRAKEPSRFVVDCMAQAQRKPFHYPGDNETFGEGFRLTDLLGLKSLGIWFDLLPSGRRTAFPHAHTHEEEFIYVLNGETSLWLDGFTKPMKTDSFAAFPSNTGLAHTMINDSDEVVRYLCIGETQDFPSEKISYPLNSLRQKECQRKGWYWDDLQTGVTGSHSAKPEKTFADHLEFQVCTAAEASGVLNILKTSPGYFERVEGCAPTLQMAKDLIEDGPKKRSTDYFKECLIIKLNDQPIGILDLHAHHPEKDNCYLGLLLISENLLGRGLGRKCYELAEDYIVRALGCQKILLGISDDNDLSGFWKKMGFELNDKTYDWTGAEKTTRIRELEKDLRTAKTPL